MIPGFAWDELRRPWAILPEALGQLAIFCSLRSAWPSRGTVLRANYTPGVRRSAGAIVIPIQGVIRYRPGPFAELFGECSMVGLSKTLRSAVSDPASSSIVLDIDSPGGSVDGVPELADQIYAARSKKKIIAIANCMAASAAYWLASQATDVIVAPSGQVGAIGISAIHEDRSKALAASGMKISLISAGRFKTDGNMYEPLSASGRADLQHKVDSFHSMFVSTVARGRGISESQVRSRFGQGRIVLAEDAAAAGMVDRIATIDQVLSGKSASSTRRRPSSALDWRVQLLARELEFLDICRRHQRQ